MTPSNIKLGFSRTGVWQVNPAVFKDSTFSVSAPYTLTTDDNAVDPWLDVHARIFLRGELLASSATVTNSGTVCTAVGAHVKSAAVLDVLRQRAAKRGQDAERQRIAAAAAAQKKTEHAAATEANAARRATAATLRTVRVQRGRGGEPARGGRRSCLHSSARSPPPREARHCESAGGRAACVNSLCLCVLSAISCSSNGEPSRW